MAVGVAMTSSLFGRGVWNVPLINQAILISGSWLRRNAHDLPSWESQVLDSDMAFAAWMRERVQPDRPPHLHTDFLPPLTSRVTSCTSVISMTTVTFSMETLMIPHISMVTCTRCLTIAW